MLAVAQAEAFFQLAGEAPYVFFIHRVAAALAQRSAGRWRAAGAHANPAVALLLGALAGLAGLIVELPVDLIGQLTAQLEAVFQADALAVAAVAGVAATDQGVAEHWSADWDVAGLVVFAAHLGIGVVGKAFVDQLQAVAFGVVPAELGQQVVGGEVHRVGVLAGIAVAAGAAKAINGLAAAPADVQQGVELILAAGQGSAALPAVVTAVVAGFQPREAVVARFQIVTSVLGDKAHRAADGVTAVQGAGRATDDLDLLHRVQVDVVALGAEEWAEGKGIGYANTVDLGQHAIATDAADAEAGQAETAAAAAH